MSPSSSGKWVSRAAATGGGRTYRGQVPVNWYAGLVVIVILGLVSIVIARHDYQHPSKTSAVQPAVGTTLFAGYAFDICGTVQKPLAASTTADASGITTPGSGVLNVSPLVSSEAGNNATLGEFVKGYRTISLSATKLKIPGHAAYVNGQKCAAGTKYAGMAAQVKVETWPNVVTTAGTVLSGDPSAFKIGARNLITIGFVPKDAKLPRPPQSVINEVLGLSGTVSNGTTTTTTTAPASTTTTAPGSTTTTSPTSTTTSTPSKSTTTTTG